jgi:hypothetical protein
MSPPVDGTIVRVVYYRDGGDPTQWVAHALEFDLVGAGPSREAAVAALAEAIGFQVADCGHPDTHPNNLYASAPAEYHEQYAAGRDCARAEVVVRGGRVLLLFRED